MGASDILLDTYCFPDHRIYCFPFRFPSFESNTMLTYHDRIKQLSETEPYCKPVRLLLYICCVILAILCVVMLVSHFEEIRAMCGARRLTDAEIDNLDPAIFDSKV